MKRFLSLRNAQTIEPTTAWRADYSLYHYIESTLLYIDNTYVSLQQFLPIILDVVQNARVSARVHDHLTTPIRQIQRGYVTVHSKRPDKILKKKHAISVRQKRHYGLIGVGKNSMRAVSLGFK